MSARCEKQGSKRFVSNEKILVEQVMKLILFVLFSGIIFVQSKITPKNKTLLIKAGDPFTLECDDPSAKWRLKGRIIANCTNCPSSTCNIDEAYRNRITAFCKQGYSVLHFISTQLEDKGTLQCPASGSTNFLLLVGIYNTAHFHSENKFPFALIQKDYTLVCDKEQNGEMIMYNGEGKVLIYFGDDCSVLQPNSDENRFDITCDAKHNKVKFHMKQVSLSQDGNIIGCERERHLYLFRLTVNVPVTSVSIQLQSQDLLENKDGVFVCKVEESKPEASFKWIIAYQNGSLQEIQQKTSISKRANGRLWQTNSTLTLEMKRDYEKIMCKARIENMHWTISKYQLLDIKYSLQGKPRIILSQSGICAGKNIEIKCEWKGGHPEAILILASLNQIKKGQSSVSIKKKVTREMSRFCICNGKQIDTEKSITEELDIQYPPNNVTINQTSYLEGQTASLICEASGGNPAVYNYTWSPGNYPPANVIQINLTRALNKKPVTCKVHHNCDGGNPVSSTIKLNVEYYPIINTTDNMTVIEYETNEFSCLAEGNPKPTITWKIRNQIIKSKLLRVSFNRSNVREVQCIATAHSSKHGILKSSKIISIFVTYPPVIAIHHNVTNFQQKAQINCTAHANPNNIQYRMVQKWGTIIRKDIPKNTVTIQNVSFQDMGTWICLASNDIPKRNYYSEKSAEIKLNVVAEFKGNQNETATVGSEKLLKICYYCYPDATVVKWYKGNEEIPFDRIFYIPAKEGLFPFPGKCSILELKINEKVVQIYSLQVINPVGQRTFELTLETVIPSNSSTEPPIYIIVSSVIAVIVVLIIIGGIIYFKFRRSSNKTQNNTIPINNLGMSKGQEDEDEPRYGEISNSRSGKGQEDEDEPRYGEISNSRSGKGQEDEDEPVYNVIDTLSVEAYTGQQDGTEPPYIDLINGPPVKGQEHGTEPPYINVTNRSPPKGHLDYENLGN